MYNDVYRLWIAAGVAKQLPEPVWMDGGGQIVKTENEAVRLMVDVDLLFPDEVIVGWTMEQSRPRSKWVRIRLKIWPMKVPQLVRMMAINCCGRIVTLWLFLALSKTG
jgi:hypothetical protein